MPTGAIIQSSATSNSGVGSATENSTSKTLEPAPDSTRAHNRRSGTGCRAVRGRALRAISLLEVPTEAAVTTAERLRDTRPNQRVHEHSTGFDDQPVGENR